MADAPAPTPAAPSTPTAPAPAASDAAASMRETLPDLSGGRSFEARKEAAEAHARELAGPPSPEAKKEGEAAAAEEAAKPSRAERRREALNNQREARALAQQRRELQEARRGFSTLEEAAKAGDPDKILRALGYDPDRYQNDRILATLKAGAAPDPVEEQIKAAVAPLLEKLQTYEQRQAEERQAAQTQAHTEAMITTHVAPLFEGEGATKHEALLSQFDSKRAASDYVYAVGLDHFQKTGEIKEPAEIARILEEHVADEIAKDLEKRSRLSKFKDKFAPPPDATPPAKRTLTNGHGPPPAADRLRMLNPLPDRESQIAEVLAVTRARSRTAAG